MKRAERGDTVAVHYIGTLDNGRIFDSTEGGEALRFTLGSGEVFPALEEGVLGMAPGEVKNLLVAAAEAYGPRRSENVVTLRRLFFPAGRGLAVGQRLSISLSSGRQLPMRVVAVGEDEVTLDGNHPLAGLDLTFALRLEGIG